MTGAAGAVSNIVVCYVEQNGSIKVQGSIVTSAAAPPGSSGSGLVKCSASDALGLYALQITGGSMSTSAAPAGTYLMAAFIGSS